MSRGSATDIGCERLNYSIEIQLVDEFNNPVAFIPFVLNTSSGKREGTSDAQGIIRVDELLATPLQLVLETQSLLGEMEQRKLRISRKESTVRKAAEEQGYIWHYLKVGQLLGEAPKFEHWQRPLPKYHFPSETFSGYRLHPCPERNVERYVLEICPFRSWLPLLEATDEYNMINAYNMSLFAILAYADGDINTGQGISSGSVEHFFYEQLQDLNHHPNKVNDGYFPMVVEEVPFSQCINQVEFTDTGRKNKDTQFFYASNQDIIIIGWRGTAGFADVKTDLIGYQESTKGLFYDKHFSGTRIHSGFKAAFMATQLHDSKSDAFEKLYALLGDKNIFIAGHSLGGALALIHASTLAFNEKRPYLFTYGMPRVFSRNMVEALPDFIHHRHVNNCDTITTVPWKTNNEKIATVAIAYIRFGKLALLLMPLLERGEPTDYWHHGRIVHFNQLVGSVQTNGYTNSHQWMPKATFKILLFPHDILSLDYKEGEDTLLKHYPMYEGDYKDDIEFGFSDHSIAHYSRFLNDRVHGEICLKMGRRDDSDWLLSREDFKEELSRNPLLRTWHNPEVLHLLNMDYYLSKNSHIVGGSQEHEEAARERFLYEWLQPPFAGRQRVEQKSADLQLLEKQLLHVEDEIEVLNKKGKTISEEDEDKLNKKREQFALIKQGLREHYPEKKVILTPKEREQLRKETEQSLIKYQGAGSLF